VEESSLPYHFALDYAREPLDRRILPRVFLTLEFYPSQERPVTITAVLDSGADVSVLDGNAALGAGWTTTDIVERASDILPINGLGPGPVIPGYLHEVTAYLGAYGRFAELRLRALITMPNLLAFSVLGRSDFFEQVDVTFAEREKRLYFRFLDASVLHSYVS
jgi:hypothetical protein